ncbi:MAG: adenylate/guanylate cyclase domain-containing protein [Spirochaetota bacterium]
MRVRFLFTLSWYILSYAILLYYGGSVCPYIDGLGLAEFSRELAALFGAGLLLRIVLAQAKRQFAWFDFTVFAAMAAVLTFYNRLNYNFPLGSGLKVAVGFLATGFFVSVHAYLDQQRRNLLGGNVYAMTVSARSSVITRISVVTVSSVLLSTLTIFLVLNKDLKWLAEQPPGTVEYYRPSVLKEIIFVMLVLLALLISVIVSYARNLKLLFMNQTETLERVSAGQLDVLVPVVSNDEFGNIATHTNSMIEGLREKQKIQSVFGKMVSPGIAGRLLASDQHTLAGERLNVTVLMADVRNFTTLSENILPEELVSIMNRYFTAMVEIIHRHGGEVDKFIGDGILAIFGLEGPDKGPQQAVEAAAEMVRAAAVLTRELRREIKIGLGIHAGDVIAGRIGSPDRQEFTFLGDTVNTAARLESASKEVGKEIVVSQKVFRALSPTLQSAAWQAVGALNLKGKSHAIETFALGVTA